MTWALFFHDSKEEQETDANLILTLVQKSLVVCDRLHAAPQRAGHQGSSRSAGTFHQIDQAKKLKHHHGRVRAIAMAMQHLLASVYEGYVSTSTYAICLEVKSLTKSKLVTDWVGQILPGGYRYQSLQNQLYCSAKGWSLDDHGIPIGATVVHGFDNNSVNYVETHSRNNALFEKTKGKFCWTTQVGFVKTHATKLSSQLNPANSPRNWRLIRPFSSCPKDTFFPDHPECLRQRTRPQDSKSDAEWRELFWGKCFDRTRTALFGEMDYEKKNDLSHIKPQLLHGFAAETLDSDDENVAAGGGQEMGGGDGDGGGCGGDPTDVIKDDDEIWPGGKQPKTNPKVCFPCRRRMPILPGKCSYCKEALLSLGEMREKYGNHNLLNVYRVKKQYKKDAKQLATTKTFVFNAGSSSFLLDKGGGGGGVSYRGCRHAEVGPHFSSPTCADDEFSAFGSRTQDDPNASFSRKTLPCVMVNPAEVSSQKYIMNSAASALHLISSAVPPSALQLSSSSDAAAPPPSRHQKRYFLYDVADIGATLQARCGKDGDESSYSNWVHIMALLHEAKMFIEVVLEILEYCGGEQLVRRYANYHTEGQVSWVLYAGDLHVANEFILSVVEPAMFNAAYRECVTDLGCAHSDLTCEQFDQWCNRQDATLSFRSHVFLLRNVLRPYKQYKMGIRRKNFFLYDGARRELTPFLFALNKLKYGPQIMQDYYMIYYLASDEVRQEMTSDFFGWWGASENGDDADGLDSKIEEMNWWQQRLLTTVSQEGIQAAAFMADTQPILRELMYELTGMTRPVAYTRTKADLDIDVCAVTEYFLECGSFRRTYPPPSVGTVGMPDDAVGPSPHDTTSSYNDNVAAADDDSTTVSSPIFKLDNATPMYSTELSPDNLIQIGRNNMNAYIEEAFEHMSFEAVCFPRPVDRPKNRGDRKEVVVNNAETPTPPFERAGGPIAQIAP